MNCFVGEVNSQRSAFLPLGPTHLALSPLISHFWLLLPGMQPQSLGSPLGALYLGLPRLPWESLKGLTSQGNFPPTSLLLSALTTFVFNDKKVSEPTPNYSVEATVIRVVPSAKRGAQ